MRGEGGRESGIGKERGESCYLDDGKGGGGGGEGVG